ncbi:MAG: hypothetical protein GVY10_09310 [Verrucomicrobia bacterium]|nr:hypothetical protein [Verrucomicrobiota bacterium]
MTGSGGGGAAGGDPGSPGGDLGAAYAEVNTGGEVEAAVELANAHSEVVMAVSAGNETLVNWSFVPAEERAEAIIDAAVAYAKKNYRVVREALDAGGLAIPVVIGETGWQSVPSAVLEEAPEQDFAGVLAGVDRQEMYYARRQGWAYGDEGDSPGDGFTRPAAMFYFAAFDEPWKEADDTWGLWLAECGSSEVRP